MPAIGAGSAQDALELEARDHVGEVQIVVGVEAGRIEHVVTGRQHHGSDLQIFQARHVVIVDRPGQTDLLAQPAADTDIAIDGETARDGLRIPHVGGFPSDPIAG